MAVRQRFERLAGAAARRPVLTVSIVAALASPVVCCRSV